MARSPYRAAAAIVFMIVVGWFLQSWLETGYFTVVAVLLVWGQVAGFFLPTRYALTDETVSVRGLLSRREKSWSEFRSYHIDREGILLSPFVGASRLARFRGTSLQFHGNREDVIAFVERVMASPEESDERVGDEGQEG